MTCRAGSTLSSKTAYELQRSTAHQPQQDAAVDLQGSSGHAEPAVVGRITVATAAHVPQVCEVNMLWESHSKHHLVLLVRTKLKLVFQHVWQRRTFSRCAISVFLCVLRGLEFANVLGLWGHDVVTVGRQQGQCCRKQLRTQLGLETHLLAASCMG